MSEKTWSRVHLAAIAVWLGLVAPSMLWWSTSVLVVLMYSIYANIAGHIGAWQASHAGKEVQEQLDRMEERLERIERGSV